MALNLGELLVTLGFDSGSFKQDVNQAQKSIAGIGQQMNSSLASLDSVGASLNKLGDGAIQAGATLTASLTASLLGVGVAAAKMAMDAVESENLFEVAMGGMAETAREFSEDVREQLGLNAYEVRKNIATFNAMFDAMGIGEKSAFDMSKGLTKLSYDMASFFNLKPAEAFEKLQAGISGEVEPLKRLGIVINETTIKTYALKTGMIEQGQELSEQQKIFARYGAIMEQTKNAQGDLARTMDSPTNQLRILGEQVKNVGIDLGMSLLPVVADVIAAIKPLVERIKEGVHWFSSLDAGTRKTIVTVAAMVAAIGPALIVFGGVVKVIGTLTTAVAALGKVFMFLAANPVGLVITAIGLLVIAGIALYKNWDDVKRYALNAWGRIKSFIFDTIAAIMDKYATFIGFFSDAKGEEARIAAESFRQQAASERELVDERNGMAQEEAAARAKSERLKQELAEQTKEAQKASAGEAAKYEMATMDETTAASAKSKDEKKDYLDEFDTAFDRSQDAALTKFERAQEDQTAIFKQQQEDRFSALEAQHEKERVVFERTQDARRVSFERTQEDEKTAFERAQEEKEIAFKRSLDYLQTDYERGLEDQRAAFDRSQDAEKEKFQRHQEDLLGAFQVRMDEEIDALKRKQDKERALLDSTFKTELDKLNIQKDAIRDREAAEEAARRRAEMEARATEANKALTKATLAGDPQKILDAQRNLAKSQQDIRDLDAREARQAELKKLDDKADVLRKEYDKDKDALKDKHDVAVEALKDDQKVRLTAYQRQLEDEKIAFDNRQAQKKQFFEWEQSDLKTKFQLEQADQLHAFKIEQDDQKAAFEIKQTERKRQFGIELEDQKREFLGRQEREINHLRQLQDIEFTEWKRLQEDRGTRYKQELADLRSSFEGKLAEQRRFLAKWDSMTEKMEAAAPDATGSAIPAGARETFPGQNMTATEKTSSLESAKDLAKSGKLDDAAKTLSDAWGMSLEQARKNIKNLVPPTSGSTAPASPSRGGSGRLNFFADGGITRKPIFNVAGEAGPEVIAPLSKLGDMLGGFAASVASRVAASFSNFSPDGAAAMAAVGAPVVHVYVGNREIYDLVIEATEDATKRGRG